MGYGLHLALVQGKGGAQQVLPVAGGAGADYPGPLGQQAAQLVYGLHGGAHRVALVIGIVGIEQLAFRADKGQLGGGGAGVYAQKAVAAVAFHRGLLYHGPLMAAAESLKLRLVGKEGGQALELKIHLHTGGEPLYELVHAVELCVLRLQGRAHGGKKMGILRVNGGLRGEAQCADKGLLQLRQKVERPAQKGHTAPDGLAAGKAGDGLVHHRLEYGGGQVRLGGPVVYQGLDVRLGKDAAAGGNGVYLLIVGRLGVQPGGVGLEKGGHLVYEGAGAPGADPVHPLLQAAGEVDYLGVLSAQLYGHVGLGGGMLQSRGHGHDLLYELYIQGLAQIDGAGAGYPGEQLTFPGYLPGVGEKLRQSLLGMGPVAAVVAEDYAVFIIQND